MKKEEIKKASKEIYQQVAQKHGLFVWKCVALLSMVEHLVYKASDEILKVNDLDDEGKAKLQASRIAAIDYLDKAKTRLNSATAASEDEMADFYFHISKAMNRKLCSFVNAVIKNSKKIGVTQHVESVSLIAVSMKFMETIDVYIKMSKGLPWYAYIKNNTPVDRGFEMLELCYKHCSKMLDVLDPGEHDRPEKNNAVNKQYDDIIKMWNSGDLYTKAIAYTNKNKNKNAN